MSQQPIQLYSLGTPNGHKVAIALEELGLPYEAHTINIMKGDQFTEDFKKVNPNSKIPAIVDPNGPKGQPVNVFESGAILLYLAEKTGRLLPADPVKRLEAIQWLFFQMAGVGYVMVHQYKMTSWVWLTHNPAAQCSVSLDISPNTLQKRSHTPSNVTPRKPKDSWPFWTSNWKAKNT